MENTNIKEWYLKAYPTDDMGYELNKKATFKHMASALENQKDIYDLLAVYDSIVRERVFEKLSEIMNIEYEYIWSQWLKR